MFNLILQILLIIIITVGILFTILYCAGLIFIEYVEIKPTGEDIVKALNQTLYDYFQKDCPTCPCKSECPIYTGNGSCEVHELVAYKHLVNKAMQDKKEDI